MVEALVGDAGLYRTTHPGVFATVACVKTALTAPFERASILLRVQNLHPLVRAGKLKAYDGMMDCLARVAREQGTLALWRCAELKVLLAYPTMLLTVGAHDVFTSLLPQHEDHPARGRVVASVCAGLVAAAVTFPFEHAVKKFVPESHPLFSSRVVSN